MKTVIIGCGYVGMALLAQWTESDQLVVGTTTRQERVAQIERLADQAVVMQGSDTQQMHQLLQDADRVVVCVAPGRGGDYRATYWKTAQSIAQAIKAGAKVKQVVYTSATSVYGDQRGEWVDELTEYNPIGDNAQILCDTEQLYLTQLPSDVEVTVLRLAGIYGPGRDPAQRAQFYSGKPFPGSGDAYCNYIHLDDIVGAIDWVLEHHLAGVYNVCGPDHPTRAEYYAKILTPLGLPMPIWEGQAMGPHSGNKRVSSAKLTQSGFHFRHAHL